MLDITLLPSLVFRSGDEC
uniref:Uncharacterized protein n=1 Tax=Arundo donax TaxID=35708 RepID=A0A0A9C0F3_ARUDO